MLAKPGPLKINFHLSTLEPVKKSVAGSRTLEIEQDSCHTGLKSHLPAYPSGVFAVRRGVSA